MEFDWSLRRMVVVDAPSNLGLRPPAAGSEPGVAKLAGALRRRGLVAHLGAEDAGSVPPPPYSFEPDLESWFRNGPGLKEYSPRLGDRLAELVVERKFVVVLGGDCSILIGAMLGLRGLGRYGLIYIDGHDDFSTVRRLEEFKGRLTAAGQDLAVATGQAPGGLNNLRGLAPYVREEDVAIFGFTHSPEDSKDFATERLQQTRMHTFSAAAIRARGPAAAARQALAKLDSPALAGLWIHLDADVLHLDAMPAVDSPNPHGLSFAELQEALEVFLADPRVAGLEVTIYDPDLDPTGTAGDRLEATLAAALAPLPRAEKSGFGAVGVTLEPGIPGVDARRIPAYTNLWQVTEARPGAPERLAGTWEDEVHFVERDGRTVLRRIQRATRGERTGAHLDEVDASTLEPLRATYESNGIVLADSMYEGSRLTGREIATPPGMPAGEQITVDLSVEFPRPVFDWHLWGVLLASFPLSDGYHGAFLAHTTSDAEAPLLRRIAFRVSGREMVTRGESGSVECYVVEVDAGTPWTFWISTTRRPVPVVQLKIESPDGLVRWWKPPSK